jgi:hypothetical protein
MGLFTHLMTGFLISSWISGSFHEEYVILGVLIGRSFGLRYLPLSALNLESEDI